MVVMAKLILDGILFPDWTVLPYWVIILVAIINIISIFLNSSTRKESEGNKLVGLQSVIDIKRRERISIIPRVYFVIIYTAFWIFDTSLGERSFWGRWGIFGILFIDSCLNLANYADYHWYTIMKIFHKEDKNK